MRRFHGAEVPRGRYYGDPNPTTVRIEVMNDSVLAGYFGSPMFGPVNVRVSGWFTAKICHEGGADSPADPCADFSPN